MPDPRPMNVRYGNYDDPPAAESSTPRTRRERLRRALQGTDDLAREVRGVVETNLRTRNSLLSPINRRRQRSPSDQADGSRDTPGMSSSMEDSGSRRRNKRRKLDADTSSPPIKRVKYGWYGQVEPGRLKLEVISCDGGEHKDPRHPGTYLGANNVLRHDKSVYCSIAPSSGILLRHLDDTPFCLEKLHIVGPEHGFTAPVQAGVVYVAMTMQDLKKYMDPPPHARLSGVHSPPYRRRRNHALTDSMRSSPDRLTLSDALRDPEVTAALDRRDREYAREADSAHDLASAEESYYGEDFGFGRTDPEAHCDIPSFSSSDGPDFVVSPEGDQVPVAVLSDEDAGPEELSTQEVLDFRLQRLRMMRRRHQLPWINDYPLNGYSNPRHGDSGVHPRRSYPPMHDVHDKVEGAEQDAEWDDSVTCVRFGIKAGKHKVAIKFDPGLSGRFILLKLWAGRSNVDVQSVIAKGYGGCRFFPAQRMA